MAPQSRAGLLSFPLALWGSAPSWPSVLLATASLPSTCSQVPLGSSKPRPPNIKALGGFPTTTPSLDLGLRLQLGEHRWRYWGADVTQHPQGPRSPGSAWLLQPNKFCWAINGAGRGAGRERRRHPWQSSRRLSPVTCQGKQCYRPGIAAHGTPQQRRSPRHRHGAEPAAPDCEQGPAHVWLQDGAWPGTIPWYQCGTQTQTLGRCHSASPSVLQPLVNSETKGRETSWNQRRAGAVFWENKSRGWWLQPRTHKGMGGDPHYGGSVLETASV